MARCDFASSCFTKFFSASSSAGVRVCAATCPAKNARTTAPIRNANLALRSGTLIKRRQCGPRRPSQWRTGPNDSYIHFYIGRLAVDRLVEPEFLVRFLHPDDRDAVDE